MVVLVGLHYRLGTGAYYTLSFRIFGMQEFCLTYFEKSNRRQFWHSALCIVWVNEFLMWCRMVRLIELNLETLFAVEASHFRPPTVAHRTEVVLSPGTHKKNAMKRSRDGGIVLDLSPIRSSLSFLHVKNRIFGPCLAFDYLIGV